MARGTCRPVKDYQKFSRAPGGQTGQPLNPNSQVTRVLYQLKIHWGCRSGGVPAARARGEEAVLTWGPPVKVNFELATPNSVHGCTLANLITCRMCETGWGGSTRLSFSSTNPSVSSTKSYPHASPNASPVRSARTATITTTPGPQDRMTSCTSRLSVLRRAGVGLCTAPPTL